MRSQGKQRSSSPPNIFVEIAGAGFEGSHQPAENALLSAPVKHLARSRSALRNERNRTQKREQAQNFEENRGEGVGKLSPYVPALEQHLADLWDQYTAAKPTHYSRRGKLLARIRQVEDAIGALVRADPGPFI